mmetsp:Transcript_20258/g.71617  ORF Transcript_20258/g.71617 Transcript_20258/m.71617 type:complete len:489 (+) Transcript_20258:292-1758(+)
MAHDELDSVVYLCDRREAAEAEADRRVRQLLVDADGTQDIRRLQRRRRARRAARHGDVLQRHQQALALHVRERQVHVAREPPLRVAVEHDVARLRRDAADEALGQVGHPRLVARHLRARQLSRRAQTHAERMRQRAGAQAALLAAARHLRRHAHARSPAHVERADALRAVELVRRDGEQVDVHLVDVDGELARHLRGVAVEERLVCAAQRADLGDGLHDANLVVHAHDRHQRRLRRQRLAQLLQIDEAVVLHAQVRDAEAVLLERAARVEDAFVLRLCGDDVVLALLVELRHALHRDVVRLRRTRREHDLARVGANQGRNLRARVLDGLLGLPAVPVRARVRVAVPLRQVRHHRVQHAGVERRRGLHVKVRRPPIRELGLDVEAREGLRLGVGDSRLRARRSRHSAGTHDGCAPRPHARRGAHHAASPTPRCERCNTAARCERRTPCERHGPKHRRSCEQTSPAEATAAHARRRPFGDAPRAERPHAE